MPTVHGRPPQTQREFAEEPEAEVDLAFIERAENCAWSRYRRELLGPKLVWLEERLMRRLFRYRDELERLTESAPESWSPRRRFVFVEGPFTLRPCGDHVYAVSIWPHEHLIQAIDRREEAIATARGKLQCVDRRLSKIRLTFGARDRELRRFQRENAVLRQWAPSSRRRGRR